MRRASRISAAFLLSHPLVSKGPTSWVEDLPYRWPPSAAMAASGIKHREARVYLREVCERGARGTCVGLTHGAGMAQLCFSLTYHLAELLGVVSRLLGPEELFVADVVWSFAASDVCRSPAEPLSR